MKKYITLTESQFNKIVKEAATRFLRMNESSEREEFFQTVNEMDEYQKYEFCARNLTCGQMLEDMYWWFSSNNGTMEEFLQNELNKIAPTENNF